MDEQEFFKKMNIENLLQERFTKETEKLKLKLEKNDIKLSSDTHGLSGNPSNIQKCKI